MSNKKLAEGIICRDELYTLPALKKVLGLTDASLRSLRIAGFPIIRFGKRGFVSGQQAIDFLENISEFSDRKSRLPK